MTVNLKEIDKDNWRECIKLKVSKEQENFVGSNENSLAMLNFYPLKALVIYKDQTMVGFVMYGIDDKSGIHYINRFMIDQNYQNKGYGKQALIKLIEKLKNESNIKELEIIYKPDNIRAENLYESIGFKKTGEMFNNEIISKIYLE